MAAPRRILTMKNVVIVGAGHGAGQVVASLRQKQFAGRITLLGEESWYPYQRPPLSKKFLAGEMPAERLYFKPESFYDDPKISVYLQTRVVSIDRNARRVTTESGDTFPYDALVIATGGRPRKLGVQGADLASVHYLRGIGDINNIREDVAKSRRIAIVGAGYIGLEVAAVASKLGLNVTVIEMESRVMSRVVSPELSTFYEAMHRKNGVVLRLSTGVTGFSGEQRVDGVILDSGEILPTDLVVIGVGIVPNLELAADSGLDVANGIVVDDHCRTSDASVYAIGDCTWHPNKLLGTELRLESVHNALEQAKTAAGNICGEDLSYAQVPWFWSDQYDLKLQIAGLSQGYDQVVVRGNPEEGSFSCLYLRNGQFISIDAVNAPRDFIQAKALIAARARIDPALLADSAVQIKDMT